MLAASIGFLKRAALAFRRIWQGCSHRSCQGPLELAQEPPDVVVRLDGCTGFVASHHNVKFIVGAGHCVADSVTHATYRGITYCLKDECKVVSPTEDVGFISLRVTEGDGEGAALAAAASSVDLQDLQPQPASPVVVRGYAACGHLLQGMFRRAGKCRGLDCVCCEPGSAHGWDKFADYDCLAQTRGDCLEQGNSGSVALYEEAGGWKLYGVIPGRSCSNAAVVPLSWQKHGQLIEYAITGSGCSGNRIYAVCPGPFVLRLKELLVRIRRILQGL